MREKRKKERKDEKKQNSIKITIHKKYYKSRVGGSKYTLFHSFKVQFSFGWSLRLRFKMTHYEIRFVIACKYGFDGLWSRQSVDWVTNSDTFVTGDSRSCLGDFFFYFFFPKINQSERSGRNIFVSSSFYFNLNWKFSYLFSHAFKIEINTNTIWIELNKKNTNEWSTIKNESSRINNLFIIATKTPYMGVGPKQSPLTKQTTQNHLLFEYFWIKQNQR